MGSHDSESGQGRNQFAQVDWVEIDKLVSIWLKERQSLIVLLCAVHGLREIMSKDTPITVKIQAFCQVLMDYISAGHFEIYRKLTEEAAEFGEDASQIMQSLYPKIDLSTQESLAFNDKYATPEQCAVHLSDLNHDLSRLAELLSGRFDLEDQLIDVLHVSHRDKVV